MRNEGMTKEVGMKLKMLMWRTPTGKLSAPSAEIPYAFPQLFTIMISPLFFFPIYSVKEFPLGAAMSVAPVTSAVASHFAPVCSSNRIDGSCGTAAPAPNSLFSYNWLDVSCFVGALGCLIDRRVCRFKPRRAPDLDFGRPKNSQSNWHLNYFVFQPNKKEEAIYIRREREKIHIRLICRVFPICTTAPSGEEDKK